MRYLIKNGSIVDPAQRVATIGHVLVEEGRVAQVFDLAELTPDHDPVSGEVEVIDARGCVIAPGFTDLHTHLREPGDEHQETIASGTLAAAHGGFTTICAMPNTQPPYDTAGLVRQVRQTAHLEGHVHVDVVGALTRGCGGTTLTDMAELAEAGCMAFSDADASLHDPLLLRQAMAYAHTLGLPVMTYCEDRSLSAGWAMHEGVISTRLGLPGYPAAAEEAQIARDIALAELTGAHLHICHVSTAGGVALIRHARQRGVHITADVTPHHLTLTDAWVLGALAAHHPAYAFAPPRAPVHGEEGLRLESWLDPTRLPPYDPRTRVRPPLRSPADVEALLAGLADNTLDAIATDHAPLAPVDMQPPYAQVACGISGLETAFGLVFSLVHRGMIDMMNIIAKLTEGPARVLGRAPSSLRPGARADVVVLDPEYTWTVDTSAFVSQGRNNPLHGQTLRGQVMLTMASGAVVFRRAGFGHAPDRLPLTTSRLAGILSDDDEDDPTD